jgi:hypothetical protein
VGSFGKLEIACIYIFKQIGFTTKMKNLLTPCKFALFLVVFVLTVGASSVFAQTTAAKKPEARYVNEKLKVSFETPKSSTKKSETPEEIIFSGDAKEFGDKATVNFTGLAENDAAAVSQVIVTDEGLKIVVDSFVSGIKDSAPNNSFQLLEQKRIKIAGLSGVKIVFSGADKENPKITLRAAAYLLPSGEHKRLYLFMVASQEQHFDKWLPIGEAAVNSFTFIK